MQGSIRLITEGELRRLGVWKNGCRRFASFLGECCSYESATRYRYFSMTQHSAQYQAFIARFMFYVTSCFRKAAKTSSLAEWDSNLRSVCLRASCNPLIEFLRDFCDLWRCSVFSARSKFHNSSDRFSRVPLGIDEEVRTDHPPRFSSESLVSKNSK